MSFVYNKIKTRTMQGLLDFREAGADIRIALIKTKANTSTDTEDGRRMGRTWWCREPARPTMTPATVGK